MYCSFLPVLESEIYRTNLLLLEFTWSDVGASLLQYGQHTVESARLPRAFEKQGKQVGAISMCFYFVSYCFSPGILRRPAGKTVCRTQPCLRRFLLQISPMTFHPDDLTQRFPRGSTTLPGGSKALCPTHRLKSTHPIFSLPNLGQLLQQQSPGRCCSPHTAMM